MKVAQIAFMYGHGEAGGACIAASRLHRALLAAGVESHYICWDSNEPGENVHVLPHRGIGRAVYYLLTRCTHYCWEHTPFKKPIPLNLFPVFGLRRELGKINPDVVHLQWINEDFPSLGQIAQMDYPLVVGLHDEFPFNAIAPYAGRDRRFATGFTRGNGNWMERWLWNRKRRAFLRRPIAFCGPSEWICRECRDSVVARGANVTCVPNVMSEAFFGGLGKNTTSNRFVLLFGANGGRTNPAKGFSDLVQSVRLIPEAIRAKMELRIFGETAQEYDLDGVRVRFLGSIAKPGDLAREYASADVCVLPSRLDNAPQVKFESLVCGTPVVAFDRTGCPEWIEHSRNGWIAADGDFAGFANGILHFFRLWECHELSARRTLIAAKAREDFSTKRIVERMCFVYEDAVSRWSHGET